MKKVLKNSKGFTLMEVVVVLGIIALLTAIMTPLVLNYMEEARKTKAAADVASIKSAIQQYVNDVRDWPAADNATNAERLYTGDYATDLPTDAGGCASAAANDYALKGYLIEKPSSIDAWDGKKGWNGSYIENDIVDPWGQSYIVYVERFFGDIGTKHAWVLSAGPDGTIDTCPSDSTTNDDDIGKKIR